MRMMIFGAGYSGKTIGSLVASQGHTVAGTTRSAEKMPAFGGIRDTPSRLRRHVDFA